MSMSQRGRLPQRGRRAPVVAAVVAVALLAVGGAAAVLLLRDDPGDRDAEEKDVFALAVGDCVNGVSGAGDDAEEFESTPVVQCREPHEAEVITSFDLEQDGEYPGEQAVIAESEDQCVDLLMEALTGLPEKAELMPFYFYPTQESWERADDRTVHCLAMPAEGTTTGSLLDR